MDGAVIEEENEVAARLGVEELAAVRKLALRAHPDVVAELVGGGSVAEVVASLEQARAAYRRVVEMAGAAKGPIASVVPVVPAGGVAALAVDPEALPATEKIRRGLAGRGAR